MPDDSPHAEFVRGLTQEELMLITLRDELYVGSWERMLADLRDRLQGRPYIFKLVNRIEEDLTRIERLQSYELKHRVNLSDLVRQAQSGTAATPDVGGTSA
jgi:hypothetical protein